MKRVLPYIALFLFLAEIVLILVSWLMSAALPTSGVRSMLSGEGLRWFMGHFGNILATPQLSWLILGAIVTSVIVAVLAGAFPARWASKIKPLDAIAQ